MFPKFSIYCTLLFSAEDEEFLDLSDVDEETTLELQMELERAELGKRMAEKRLLKLMRLLERVSPILSLLNMRYVTAPSSFAIFLCFLLETGEFELFVKNCCLFLLGFWRCF